MRIELIDRIKWLELVRAAINSIQQRRAKQDAEYETAWAAKYDSRSPLRRFWCGPRCRIPPHGTGWNGKGIFFYPSIYAWGDLEKLKRIEKALLTEGTGAVFVSGDEMRAVL